MPPNQALHLTAATWRKFVYIATILAWKGQYNIVGGAPELDRWAADFQPDVVYTF